MTDGERIGAPREGRPGRTLTIDEIRGMGFEWPRCAVIEKNCSVRDKLTSLQKDINGSLSKITLDDLLQKHATKTKAK